MSKGKVAFYWAGSCGGCEVAVIDIDEMLFDVLDHYDILFWPVAIDTKYDDIRKLNEKELDVCFFNGCIRNEENKEMARLLRDKSKVLIAFGSCSQLGGIPGLGNLSTREEILNYIYCQTKSTVNDNNTLPCECHDNNGNILHLPILEKSVRALDDVVEVDYYIPGCPPPLEIIQNAIKALVTGDIAKADAVLCPEKTVCDECKKERHDKSIKNVRRLYDGEIDPNKCLIEQGIICMGPSTREGCNAACLSANMPCTGCMGPPPASTEQGSRMVSAVASLVGAEDEKISDEKDVAQSLKELRDPAGIFYMYSMPKSILKRRYDE
ncbi:MAG: NADH-quinone oxidoreductase subunit B family protein [Candidatus Methanofastidiosia archaeon]